MEGSLSGESLRQIPGMDSLDQDKAPPLGGAKRGAGEFKNGAGFRMGKGNCRRKV
jgi:hypothetical protein